MSYGHDSDTPQVYGLIAEYDDPDDLVIAATSAYSEGYRDLDAYTPFPVHGLSEAIGFHKTILPLFTLVAGLSGSFYSLTIEDIPMADKADDKKVVLNFAGTIDNWYFSMNPVNNHLSVRGLSRDIPNTKKGEDVEVHCRDNNLCSRGVRSGHTFDGFYYRYKLGIERGAV